jgi:hypothetical protein
MRGRRVATTLALGMFASLSVASTADASSHREAPFIAKNPKVDGTDFYMFNSYESGRAGYVTILANYQPLQVPAGGPNFYQMDKDALYEIEIDNVGDGHEHLTFQFQFSDPLDTSGSFLSLNVGPDAGVPVTVPFLNIAPLGATTPSTFNAGTNRNEMYTVTLVTGDRRTGTAAPVTAALGGATSFQRPIDYIGNTTFGDASSYEAYARTFIQNVAIPGCTPPTGTTPRVWVGQRQEPFAVNLGVVFDLLDAPSIAGVLAGGDPNASDCATDAGANCPEANPIGGYNITTIALEVPASCLTAGGSTTIGAWTTASVRQARVINPAGTYATPTKEGGAWAQVSRLGMPLVNELVIGLKDKDTFNASDPVNDPANFATYVTNPTLPAVIQALYGPTVTSGVADAPTAFPRADLVAAFLTGVPGVNQIPATGDAASAVPSEMLRLNTAFAAKAASAQSSLGALTCFARGGEGALAGSLPASCDTAGFPNGRRPGDDVVDVTLRVAEGYLLPTDVSPGGGVAWTDAVEVDATKFTSVFPYFNTPNSGNP